MERNGLVLPVSIVSPTDVARLAREVESVENFFREQAIRQPGQPTGMPRLSKLMDQLVTDNQLNLLQDADRKVISDVLDKLHASAPIMHISFSVDPPGPYVQKIVTWLRRNIHPYVLVTVGLQPNIGAGCVVRTTNKMFDFSLREYFSQKRGFFIEKLHEAITDTSVQIAEDVITIAGAAPQTAGSPVQPVVASVQAPAVVSGVAQ
jgi:F0F1-type ATP synthase delta subunit